MMKKIMMSGLLALGIASLVQAKVKVINNLPWKIRFTVHWTGKLPIDGNIFNTRDDNWRDEYSFDVDPDQEIDQDADALNIKNRYEVKIYDDKGQFVKTDTGSINWYDKSTDEWGNRLLNVNNKIIDAATGKFVVKVDSALM